MTSSPTYCERTGWRLLLGDRRLLHACAELLVDLTAPWASNNEDPHPARPPLPMSLPAHTDVDYPTDTTRNNLWTNTPVRPDHTRHYHLNEC